jgi:hypothetical protein
VVKHRADIAIPVLPLSFIKYLINEARRRGFIVVKAEMLNLHNCETQPCVYMDPDRDTIAESKDKVTGKKFYRHFRFVGFEILDDIVIKSRPFTRENLRSKFAGKKDRKEGVR